jgi:excisionase family DNA binding protein
MSDEKGNRPSNRMSVDEIARRFDIGRLAVYAMLEQGILPGIRLGRRWIVTRHAYEEWERTCGTRSNPGLQNEPEVRVH